MQWQAVRLRLAAFEKERHRAFLCKTFHYNNLLLQSKGSL